MTDDAPEQPTVQDLINTCIGEKPDEFAAKFNELMQNRLRTAVSGRKIELSAALFGTPESQTDITDTIKQAHDDVNGDTDQEEENNDDETA